MEIRKTSMKNWGALAPLSIQEEETPMKGYFTRNPVDIKDLERVKGRCTVTPIKAIATVELEAEEYDHFKRNLLEDYDFIEEHTENSGIDKDGNALCILVRAKGQKETIAVEPEGYSYARYAAIVIED